MVKVHLRFDNSPQSHTGLGVIIRIDGDRPKEV